MLDSLLDQLARQRGIGDAYHNYRGELLHISRETKTAILAAMGCATSDAEAIQRELHELETGRLRSLLPPVAVVHPHRNNVTLAVPADSLSREIAWRIATECGTEISGRVCAGELPEADSLTEICGGALSSTMAFGSTAWKSVLPMRRSR